MPAIPFLVYSAALFIPQIKCEKWARAMLSVPAAILVLALPSVLMAAYALNADLLRNGSEPLLTKKQQSREQPLAYEGE